MGFFDSFSKKKEGGNDAKIGMPPPPKLETEIPVPKTPSGFAPPIYHPESHETKEDKIIPPPVFQKQPSENILPPPQKPEQNAPNFENVIRDIKVPYFTNQELPPTFQKVRIQKSEPPEMLPGLPKVKIYEENSLEQFRLDNIPAFAPSPGPAENELEELPEIEIWSGEETPYTNFKYESLRKPLFIRTDHFGEVVSTIDLIKSCVEESTEVITSLETLKKNSEIELSNYKSSLEDLQRKLIYVDKVLFERGDQ